MKNFYIYVYLDPRKKGKYVYDKLEFNMEPFYLGKGRDDRCYKHLSEAYNNRDDNDHKCNVIRKIKRELGQDPLIIKIFTDLDEDEAFKIERECIHIIGRQDLNTGPLTNKTEGGEGWAGFKLSTESREKMRQSLIIYYQYNKNPFAGKRHSDSSKQKMRKPKKYKNGNPRIGNPLSIELKNKISECVKISKKYREYHKKSFTDYTLISPNGSTYYFKGQEKLFTFCKEMKLSFYGLIKYINNVVPIYTPGAGIGTVERINTNGWKLLTAN